MKKKTTKLNVRIKEKENYINNAQFLQHMKKYYAECQYAKETSTKEPSIDDYICTCIIDIANKLSNKFNFVNYPFKDEMTSDGIENCLMYIKNFNPNRSTNPFAYFTKIIYYAFLRRIQKEKKQLYTKYKCAELYMNSDTYEELGPNVSIYGSEYHDKNMREFVDNFEKNVKEKSVKQKRIRKKVGLEKFCIEEGDDE